VRRGSGGLNWYARGKGLGKPWGEIKGEREGGEMRWEERGVGRGGGENKKMVRGEGRDVWRRDGCAWREEGCLSCKNGSEGTQ
jgi:hypothetical protein